MEIVDNKKLVPFGELDIGEVFQINCGETCIVISEIDYNGIFCNTMSLDCFDFYNMTDDFLVKPRKARLILD